MNKTDLDLKDYTKGLFELFWSFFKIGTITFGGGLAMLPFLENELSKNRKWTTKDELLDYYAIGQSTPGIIAINVATFVGYKRRGIIGGIFGTLGMVAPSILIITFIAVFLSNFTDIPVVQKALAGINIAVAALLTKVSWTFAKGAIKHVYQAFIAVIAFTAIFLLKIHTAWIILSALALGIGIHFIGLEISKREAHNDNV